uniref:Uncharacterized protein n=1 Tax=Timema tahoe TaxID=61484 RepID=A0A7R9IRM8_9NEOP|nr:unnamed protein product [Timema tahoe]
MHCTIPPRPNRHPGEQDLEVFYDIDVVSSLALFFSQLVLSSRQTGASYESSGLRQCDDVIGKTHCHIEGEGCQESQCSLYAKRPAREDAPALTSDAWDVTGGVPGTNKFGQEPTSLDKNQQVWNREKRVRDKSTGSGARGREKDMTQCQQPIRERGAWSRDQLQANQRRIISGQPHHLYYMFFPVYIFVVTYFVCNVLTCRSLGSPLTGSVSTFVHQLFGVGQLADHHFILLCTSNSRNHIVCSLLLILGCLLPYSHTENSPNKWVWSSNGRSIDGISYDTEEGNSHSSYRPKNDYTRLNNNYSTPNRDSNLDFSVIGSLVYCESSVLDHVATEAAPIYENEGDNNQFRPPLRPMRPFPQPPLPPPDYQQYRPPINNNYNNNNNNNRPGPGVLTGSLPSLNGDRQYHEYDRCKCAHSFNCESPGIQFVYYAPGTLPRWAHHSSRDFTLESAKRPAEAGIPISTTWGSALTELGHCDTDKKYCCYNLKPGHHQETNPGNRGPGGGFGAGPGSNGRPIYDRPVLVGPGGPTGIVSGPNRPPYSQYGREDTDNYRPRPDRNYYEPYGRSASSNQRKTVEKS